MARRSPALAVLFLVPALSLAGLPPFSGFLAKFAIVRAGVVDAQWAGVAVALVVSLLTLVSMVKIWVSVFWGEAGTAGNGPAVGVMRHRRAMGLSTAAIVGLSLAIAFCAGPLYDYAARAAEQLLDVAGYVSAVRSS
jgi:multicomponent Na+:H+ antiporter subunit D